MIKENFKKHSKKGFTLVETLVGLFIFVLLTSVVYATSAALIRETGYYRQYTTISGLADQYLELARNLPYSKLGTINGNPPGPLPDEPNATTTTISGVRYSIYYVVNYIDDSADGTALLGTDTAPNDYKQIKLYITNTSNGAVSKFLTNVVPKGLESLSSGGALYIKVFDAVGQPIPNATVNIVNTILNPDINLTRTTDASGNWVEVGLPNSANSYHIVVTKDGYSSDQTYPISGGNPNPTKTDATISNGQVTQISFSIDKTSTLVFNTLDQICNDISSVGLEVKGTKLIGTPSLVKFDHTYTSDSNGQITLNNTEWDTYTPTLTTNSLMIFGSSPIQQINLLPDTSQQFTLILGPKTTNSLLVIVKDAATKNALEGASVDLQTFSPSTDNIKTTGGSIWTQSNWVGGSGQANFTDATKYFADDGHVNVNVTPTGLRLASLGNVYNTSGVLTSSTFDTGTASSSYTTINWQPTSQDASTTIKFQIASNNDNATWNFVGPDGTASTYYTVPGTTISNSNTNNRYVRYKAFLGTTNTAKTPVLTSVSINYVSGCFTPGQVMYGGLTAGSGYQVVVGMTGYLNKTVSNLSISGNNVLSILLSK